MIGELLIKRLNKNELPFFLQGLTEQQLFRYIDIKSKERKILVTKLRLELNKRNEFIYRKQEKSKFMAGKGGLSSIVFSLIKEELKEKR
jgi:hypothetical protein